VFTLDAARLHLPCLASVSIERRNRPPNTDMTSGEGFSVKLQRYGRLAALCAAGALALTACGSETEGGDAQATPSGSAGVSGLSGTLSGAGASSQQAAMQAWAAGFQQANPEATVNYDPVGSGGGREQFLAGGVPFAGSDRALKDDEIAKAKTRCEGGDAISLPVYISPIAVAYNLEGVEELKLSPAVLAGIFNQKITKWNAPEIAADNAGVTLPDLEITPVNRADDSGTTENFTDYLAAAAGDAWPYEPDGEWPVAGGEAAQGTSGVIQAIKGGQGTIGYADASQVGDLGTAAVKVGEEFVEYSPEAAAAVVEGSPRAEGRPQGDLAIEIARDTKESGNYPIVLVSYQIACTSTPTPSRPSWSRLPHLHREASRARRPRPTRPAPRRSRPVCAAS
jgi:phosphate transport system substrate-binding protein